MRDLRADEGQSSADKARSGGASVVRVRYFTRRRMCGGSMDRR